jgi:Tol biopolymer transport system component
VYSDVSANETWRINQNGFPEKVYPQAGGLPSPDGTKLLLEREDDLWVADLSTGTETNLTGGNQRLEADGQWWPANLDKIIFSSIDLEQGWEMSAGQPTVMSLDGSNYQTLADTSGFWGPAPSPNGDTIAFDSGDAAWLYHLDSGIRKQFDTAAMGMETPVDLKIGSPSWSPNGNQIAWWVGASFGGGPFQMGLVVFDLQEKSARFLHQYLPVGGSGGWLPPAQWSPDGQWLAFTTRDERRTPVLWVARGDGGAAHDLGEGALPLWSPDSQQVIYVTYDDTGNFAGMSVVNRQAWQPMALDLPPASQPIAWLEH